MRHRDLAWRGLGAAVFAAAALLNFSSYGGAVALPALCIALVGSVLMIQGRRLPAAFRIELGKHQTLAQAIHDRRRERLGHAKS